MSISNPLSSETPPNQTLQLPFQPENQTNKNNPVEIQHFKNRETCKQFRMGYCRYGGNCRFKHDMEKRLDFYAKKRVGMLEMGQWVDGKRMVRDCKWSLEMCPYGEKCVFGHKVELSCKRMLERSDDGVVAKRGCRMSGQEFGQMNELRCREGVRKTRLCYKWEKFGCCSFGEACHYAHGRGELKQNGSLSYLDLAPNRTSGRTGSSSCSRQKTQGKKFLFKWTDIEKISRIYADWIDLAPVY